MSEILFVVEDDPAGGLTARANDEDITARGATRDQLIEAIHEAMDRHFLDRDAERPDTIRVHYVQHRRHEHPGGAAGE